MSDTALPAIVRFDTTANRTAFTPSPGVSQQLYIWLDSDNQPNAYYWDGAAWQAFNASSSGITQLTGDVLAGPGSGSQAATLKTAAKTRAITFSIDGGGSALTTGIKADVYVPYACTITAVTMLADQSGSIVVDIWKDTLANYPPTVADTITASAPPTISSAVKSQDSTLTGWTTSISAGDTLRFNINSASTITRLSLVLTVTV